MTETRTRYLVLMVLLLAAIRFVIVPWIDYQSELVENLTVLTQRLDRSSAVLQNEAKIKAAEASVTKSLLELRPRFPEYPAVEPFQLETQQRLNQIAASRAVNINVFAWMMDEPVVEGVVHRSRGRLMAMGKIGDLAVFQAELETRFPSSSVVESNLISSGEMGSASSGTLNLVMDFHFRIQKPVPAQGGQP